MKALALGDMLGPLLVVVMGALVVSPAEGRVFSKCELKAELEAELPEMEDMGDRLQDILAKIVCKVEFTSQFNTSLVTAFDMPRPFFPGDRPGRPGRPGRPSRPSLPGDSGEGSGSDEGGTPGPPSPPWARPLRPSWVPGRRGKRAAMGRFPPMGSFPPPQESLEESEESKEVEEDSSSWTLYGLFQLADRVVCESEDTPSLNICQIPCSDLIDDDITDDIVCVKELKRTHDKMKFDPKQKFFALAMRAKMMAMMFPRECFAVTASDYFAECQ